MIFFQSLYLFNHQNQISINYDEVWVRWAQHLSSSIWNTTRAYHRCSSKAVQKKYIIWVFQGWCVFGWSGYWCQSPQGAHIMDNRNWGRLSGWPVEKGSFKKITEKVWEKRWGGEKRRNEHEKAINAQNKLINIRQILIISTFIDCQHWISTHQWKLRKRVILF